MFYYKTIKPPQYEFCAYGIDCLMFLDEEIKSNRINSSELVLVITNYNVVCKKCAPRRINSIYNTIINLAKQTVEFGNAEMTVDLIHLLNNDSKDIIEEVK